MQDGQIIVARHPNHFLYNPPQMRILCELHVSESAFLLPAAVPLGAYPRSLAVQLETVALEKVRTAASL